MNMREKHILKFYDLLQTLETKIGGKLTLEKCHGRMNWPKRGVYIFFENDRVVRIGTHALKAHSKTTLWKRLSQHRGIVKSGGGNHRGSIFRLLVGEALQMRQGGSTIPSWGLKGDIASASKAINTTPDLIKKKESIIEKNVTQYIGKLPFLYLNIPDEAGIDSDRGFIERNSIALLSTYHTEQLAASNKLWLGSHSQREKVRRSALWNNNHVRDNYDEAVLDVFEKFILITNPV